MAARLLRPTACGGALLAAGTLLVWAGPSDVASALAADRSVDQQIGDLAGLAAWGCLLWLAAGALAALAAHLPGAVGGAASLVCARITPALVRRAVEAAVGAVVLTSSMGASALAHGSAAVSAVQIHGSVDASIGDRPAGPAAVDVEPPIDDFDRPTPAPSPDPTATKPVPPPTTPHPRRTPTPRHETPASRTGTARLSPDQFGRPPARVAAPLPVLAGPAAAPTDNEVDEVVVVVRGDTLWGIAARHLGADATAAEIGAAWRRWYAANRAGVGPDPDLIRPGLRLTPPR
jgi:hypothetical protein